MRFSCPLIAPTEEGHLRLNEGIGLFGSVDFHVSDIFARRCDSVVLKSLISHAK
jgi:hypothetical protein